MSILLTGGAGYIGSHTAVELLDSGYDVVIADNLSNSDKSVIERIKKITHKNIKFYEIDICQYNELEKVFIENKIDAVIHLAGYKAVGESVEKPVIYYRNNIDSMLTLLELMSKYNVKKIVFSSSATVYGAQPKVPCVETDFTGNCTNPYGWTKYMIEQILKDLSYSDKSFSVVALRYFNPVGAHKSGLIGENPKGIPNNLMPYISQVAAGKLKELSVFGDDYETKDGTGVRDYIHVVDLAKGHVSAIKYVDEHLGFEAINLGTGVGYSVLDMIKAFYEANDITIDYKIAQRRPGDIAEMYANPKKANVKLNWFATHDIKDMCKDTWNWQKFITE